MDQDNQSQRVHPYVQYNITVKQLTDLVDGYKNRSFDEDLRSIQELEGLTGISTSLQVSLDQGVSTGDIENRENAFGKNSRGERETTSFCQLCWEALGDVTLRALLIMGVASLFLGAFLGEHPEHEWIEGFAIILAVFIVVMVTAINDYQKEKKFRELQESYKNRQQVSVLRNGSYELINPDFLVVGDIIQIDSGLIIPADGILIQGNSVFMDESAMTGENDQIAKAGCQDCMKLLEDYLQRHKIDQNQKSADLHHAVPSPIVLSGTTISEGSGRLLLIAVGINSAEGRIIDLSTQEDDQTPLQKKLNKIAMDISKLGFACALFAIVVLFLRFFIELGLGVTSFSSETALEFVQYFTIGVTVLVVAIPEGLPLAVTISLAYSVQKMQRDNNLVKRMHACETMGGANMICSDKTGTLTTNNMTVANYMVDKVIHDFSNQNVDTNVFSHQYFAYLKEAICVNSSATLTDSGEEGSKTELAMLKLLRDLGHGDFEQVRRTYAERPSLIFPFNSTRKRSSVVISLDQAGSRRRVHVKGASEIVFDLCQYILDTNGNPKMIQSEQRQQYMELVYSMNQSGLRTICLAFSDLEPSFNIEALDENKFPLVETVPLTCIGIVGIKDPVRNGVPEAVDTCKRAHIKVRMITGDNEITASAIARECHIITGEDEERVIRGVDFFERVKGIVCKNCGTDVCGCTRNPKEVNDNVKLRVDVIGDLDAFTQLIGKIDVMARSRPEDKYAMVTGLNQLGHVVAVTGDGTNDAPALRKADIGFAMGIQGTMLARETADIILLDDNFASIVLAVKWGRNIYDNIRRFIQFQLTVNVVAVSAAILGAVTIKQSPLTAVQMLWVNLIMDTFASLALATEEPRDELLDRYPQRRAESIVSKLMWKHIFGQAFLQCSIIFIMMYVGESFLPEFGDTDEDSVKVNPDNEDMVIAGRMYHFDGEKDYYENYKDGDVGPSRHFTYIFNTFVFLQLFNELNCRRIKDEVNIFQGLQKSWLFIGILLFTAGAQALMVQVGQYAFSCHKQGLTWEQWFICIGIGTISLIWRLLLLLFPETWFKEYGIEEADLDSDALGSFLVRRGTNGQQRGMSLQQFTLLHSIVFQIYHQDQFPL